MSVDDKDARTAGNASDNASIDMADRLKTWLPILLVLVAGAIYAATSVDVISRSDSHSNRLNLALVGLVVVVCYGLLAKANRNKTLKLFSTEWWLLLILSGSYLFGGFNYYQFDSRFFEKMVDNYDITYYYLNSKYFSEIDYFYLYPAILIADEDKNNRLSYIKRYRDLNSYEKVNRNFLDSSRVEVKSRFTLARWEAFSYDVDYLISRNKKSTWKYFFIDHGYNPPPTWTVLGGFLSSSTDVEDI